MSGQRRVQGAYGPRSYRLYRPATPGPHPIVVIFLSRGRWVLGDEQSDDPFLLSATSAAAAE